MNKKAVFLILSLAVSAADTLVGANVTDPVNSNASVRKELMTNLSVQESSQYINNTDGFRATFKSGKRVRLNLGKDFKKYMVNTEFRDSVNALVDDPLEQIWSDVSALDLSDSKVEDIGALAGLSNLHRLILADTLVKNINPLAGLKNLKFIDLSFTQVEDISPLDGLYNLNFLNLSHTQVQNIGPLAELVNLQALHLSYTRVEDIKPVQELKKLKTLFLANTQVKFVDSLAGLANLEWLDLFDTQVDDIKPLDTLKNTTIEYRRSIISPTKTPIKPINSDESIFDKILTLFGSFFSSDKKRMR